MRDFYTEWEALELLKDEENPDIPVLLSKRVTPICWLESFKDCASKTFGVRNTPVSFVICDEVAVPSEVDDPLLAGSSFSSALGSILTELVRYLNHTNPLFIMTLCTLCLRLQLETQYMHQRLDPFQGGMEEKHG